MNEKDDEGKNGEGRNNEGRNNEGRNEETVREKKKKSEFGFKQVRLNKRGKKRGNK